MMRLRICYWPEGQDNTEETLPPEARTKGWDLFPETRRAIYSHSIRRSKANPELDNGSSTC